MKLEKAFAIDIESNITAQRADTLFAQGKIESKYSFQCPSENCEASVTCANLDRPKAERRLAPYYKVMGEHSLKCNIAKDISSQEKRSRNATGSDSNNDKNADTIYLIELSASNKRSESTGNASGDDDTDAKTRAEHSSESGKRKIQQKKTLSSLIDAFLAKESYKVRFRNKPGVTNIEDLFVEINGQDLSKLEDKVRIYYGKAWFNKKESHYSIQFVNTLTSGVLTKRPTIYLCLENFAKSGFKRFKLEELKKADDGKPKMVFLISEKRPRVKKNKYINIWCEGPGYFDYRL